MNIDLTALLHCVHDAREHNEISEELRHVLVSNMETLSFRNPYERSQIRLDAVMNIMTWTAENIASPTEYARLWRRLGNSLAEGISIASQSNNDNNTITAQNIAVCKIHHDAKLPEYQHYGDAGADIFACASEEVKNAEYLHDEGRFVYRIPPSESRIIPTGLRIRVPYGYEAQIRPRSGLAARNQVTVLNAPGTIDSGYRGEICVILINHGKNDFIVRHGDRIAQMVIAPVVRGNFEEVAELSDDTPRGNGGFGSTGR